MTGLEKRRSEHNLSLAVYKDQTNISNELELGQNLRQLAGDIKTHLDTVEKMCAKDLTAHDIVLGQNLAKYGPELQGI
jgi:hypothetical protein